jgi:hypothetical protein
MSLFGNFASQVAAIMKQANTTSNTVTNNDLNNSPRYVDINQPRTAQFAGADVNANTYGKPDKDIFKDLVLFKKGGEISKGKNGGETVKKKFGHEGDIDPKKAQVTKLLKSGGEVLAKGNKLAKHRPTKLY